MAKNLHIGIDLDNTIINYDAVFASVARDLGLLKGEPGSHTKDAVRTIMRDRGDETGWMYLQGQVYGTFIARAPPYPGFDRFLQTVRASGAHVSIISHKTQTGHFDPRRVDLRKAALAWLGQHGIVAADGSGLDPSQVYFEASRPEKIDRILSLGCDIFIDDLPEALQHEKLRGTIETIWFAGSQPVANGGGLHPHRSWAEVLDRLLPRL